MLIPKIENRILVGILSFVGMMVLLGWAAINEGGRMQAFEELFNSRSIENGAALFSTNCSTCHGNDGRGLAGRGPGLNNPQLFGHDFFPDVSKQVERLETEQRNLKLERDQPDTPAARQAEIDTRLIAVTQEIEDLNAKRKVDLKLAVDKGYNPAEYDRLKVVNWVGTREAFIVTTLIHGRPVSGNYWSQAMPAWSQTAGGPMRLDQLQDLARYILNWDKGKDWTAEDLYAVNQFAIKPVDGAPLLFQIQQLQQSGGKLPEKVGTDVDAIMTKLAEFQGDATRGDLLYHNRANAQGNLETTQFGVGLPCFSCHSNTATAPLTEGTWTRATNERVKDPQLAGFTPEKYIVQSIVAPTAFTVPGSYSGVMPTTFGDQLSYQDLADLLAYLKTQTQ
jgi:mono/diheme cytochrome c family protein